MTAYTPKADFSKIKEAVATWSNIRQLLRAGDAGQIVPVVIPKDRRGYGWLFIVGVALYLFGVAIFSFGGALSLLAGFLGIILLGVALLSLGLGSIVEIEQGTTGIVSRFGKITGTLDPGRHYLWWPWVKVEFIVDTSTEIPYTAPVVACPTSENVPLKSIEFFLKFRINDSVAFVRNIGASNFDLFLSSAVQDAIRQRSRQVQTERAYDLRGSDVNDMQEYLNRQMARYGVRIIGANIPDVQLPDQYQQHLATRERVSKELAAYEREWELVRKQRTDNLLMEIERAKKERDSRLIEVREAMNKAREDVAKMLQERETEAQKVRWEIEARGRSMLKSAENEAKALQHLGKTYRDNRAMLQYELAQRRLAVAETLVQHAPRAVLIQTEGEDKSALTTLLMAQMLPQLMEKQQGHSNGSSEAMLKRLMEQQKS
ncbi:MAG: peptidase [Chloroflexi bacterium AL-W]|nr:peptidase [Chloroflexi bacterium AL-N1]NOK70411.1 peptidase [Chloroflexi bacterium AL-N10]NOK78089.1 peptidase [Chloroflexi bacterium AL-N5]NOK85188.1 peptidase [Chloroflexi bacterium AL-W]NOK92177.1 peptidase [Chloroflexi bacterium AL-N15]